MVLVFKVSQSGPPVVRRVLSEKGWDEYEHDEDGKELRPWNLWWKSGRFRSSDYFNCEPYQRVNHFPKSGIITKKDSLVRSLRLARAVHGPIFDFSPAAFNLPNEYTKFVQVYSDQDDKSEKAIWICKPADMSRGRKIFLIRDLMELRYDQQYVIQKYVSDPLLIKGFKFDLRLYVLVTSIHPLRVYLYKNGLVRFGTQKYDNSSLDNIYSHLTNSSINKYSPSLGLNPEIGENAKWDFLHLKAVFDQQGWDWDKTWARIQTVVIATALVLVGHVPKTGCCFELFGFDILIDSAFKPWLLEVNTSPALATDTPVDVMVKEPLIADVVDLLNLEKAVAAYDAVDHSVGTRKPRVPCFVKPTAAVADGGDSDSGDDRPKRASASSSSSMAQSLPGSSKAPGPERRPSSTGLVGCSDKGASARPVGAAASARAAKPPTGPPRSLSGAAKGPRLAGAQTSGSSTPTSSTGLKRHSSVPRQRVSATTAREAAAPSARRGSPALLPSADNVRSCTDAHAATAGGNFELIFPRTEEAWELAVELCNSLDIRAAVSWLRSQTNDRERSERSRAQTPAAAAGSGSLATPAATASASTSGGGAAGGGGGSRCNSAASAPVKRSSTSSPSVPGFRSPGLDSRPTSSARAGISSSLRARTPSM